MTTADGVDATFSATAIIRCPRAVPGAGGTVAMARLMNEEGNGERRDLA
jgi:hypothetical protein